MLENNKIWCNQKQSFPGNSPPLPSFPLDTALTNDRETAIFALYHAEPHAWIFSTTDTILTKNCCFEKSKWICTHTHTHKDRNVCTCAPSTVYVFVFEVVYELSMPQHLCQCQCTVCCYLNDTFQSYVCLCVCMWCVYNSFADAHSVYHTLA